MNAFLECLPCFLRQALNAARRSAPDDEDLSRRAVRAWTARLAELNWDQPTPALAAELYGLMARLTDCPDPFAAHKRRANERVKALLPHLESLVFKADDPLQAALELSITGNYIDAGVGQERDWEAALVGETGQSLEGGDYERFQKTVEERRDVLIVGDNAGEIGLDTLLVRALKARGVEVTYAVRPAPILNDATLEDAREVGLIDLCPVITTGARAPGAVLALCSEEFLDHLRGAGVILSKGQGNFEALRDEWPGIFYAFKVKCPVVADFLGVEEGRSIFSHH